MTATTDVRRRTADGVASLGAWFGWPLLGMLLTAVGVVHVAGIQAGTIPQAGCGMGDAVHMCDASAYFFSSTPYDWSDLPPGSTPYRYSPAFLWLMAPFQLLSWEAFGWIWLGLHVAALIWLRAGWMLAIPGLQTDAVTGNISAFMAVAIVLGLRRWPGVWSFLLLTKVTPGVGLLWFAIRREWKRLGLALGATVAILAVGLALDTRLWVEWLGTLGAARSTYEIPDRFGALELRVGLGAALVILAARIDRAWLVPIGLILALPGIWPHSLVLLAATPRLRRTDAVPVTQRP